MIVFSYRMHDESGWKLLVNATRQFGNSFMFSVLRLEVAVYWLFQ